MDTTAPETFIDYFRRRHRWWCKPGSVIYKDLIAFARDQAAAPDSVDELYLIFCTLHAIKPKPEVPSPTSEELANPPSPAEPS